MAAMSVVHGGRTARGSRRPTVVEAVEVAQVRFLPGWQMEVQTRPQAAEAVVASTWANEDRGRRS
jgi:hypothetical protein